MPILVRSDLFDGLINRLELIKLVVEDIELSGVCPVLPVSSKELDDLTEVLRRSRDVIVSVDFDGRHSEWYVVSLEVEGVTMKLFNLVNRIYTEGAEAIKCSGGGYYGEFIDSYMDITRIRSMLRFLDYPSWKKEVFGQWVD
ncbi:MAG: hypothetical protein C0179_05410 [Fervidicoccus sp.]|nr:MAG: hypothetical protein C0179_05410 [Fervidicoccus sp.]